MKPTKQPSPIITILIFFVAILVLNLAVHFFVTDPSTRAT